MNIDLDGILKSERLAISRALSFVENSDGLDIALTDSLFQYLGGAYRIGVTGPPGAGKSTLVDLLIEKWRAQDKRVGVISIDPTSPFTGGAILGDRVRMSRHYEDRGVFIRSMATRGSRGGLALQAQESADLFDAAGYDIIIYETVGVGQVELDVADAADSTLVVLVPESGDDIQAMKAGLMEIADVFVMNKADRKGANQAFAQIKSMLETRTQMEKDWTPQVVKTSALEQNGIADLMEALTQHRKHLMQAGQIKRNFRRRIEQRIRKYIDAHTLSTFWNDKRQSQFQQLIENSERDRTSPLHIAKTIIDF
ncbi:MAG: methylmalonyl Co-A mutase-associated GTPase MeaB [Candidatus Marinimicrobia bacterium]|nr:methylmalonyl Co-A mutase-associated GTPase MeaB [Candidatus Neomarinimicrobiota bacterium]MCF7851093.1 methylmalonyl Co-A mutase-associated GTPase MeaB [Candidatus Neomarinimicrobiota bacterium]MCF7905288.1 methylmalonyl Co-A mutase-associated GTPase MeaB [Candidatus Neomarinimicrobiota bacterium]